MTAGWNRNFIPEYVQLHKKPWKKISWRLSQQTNRVYFQTDFTLLKDKVWNTLITQKRGAGGEICFNQPNANKVKYNSKW